MYQFFEINISNTPQQLNTAAAIYDHEPFTLNPQEVFLDFVTAYVPQAFKTDNEVFYILFNGKAVKQAIQNKRTLVTVGKISLNSVFATLDINSNFAVNNNYEIIPVTDIFLCDLLYGLGGIFEANEIHAAIFLPYFMENRNHSEKVSLIFANVVYERFKIVSSKIYQNLNFSFFIDNKPFTVQHIQKADFCRWLVLHEYMHNSGPLSLFRSNANKFSSKHYGFIEEMRVDLTTIKVLLDNYNPNAKHALQRLNIIAIIILERIFRGALYNYRPTWHCPKTAMLAKEVEGDVSVCFMALLHHHGMLNLNERVFAIDTKQLKLLCDQILYDIYHYEQLAHDKNAFNKTSFHFATWFRNKHIFLEKTVKEFLNQYSVQNCQYTIKFN